MTSVALNEWVSAAARGDEDAFARVVDETRTLVCSIALATTRSAEASEDVAQEVYLAAWRDLRKLRNPASFLPWLRQITRNHAAQVVRRNVRERSRRVTSDADELLAAAVDPSPSSTSRLIADEEAALLAECLAALPDEAREVVTLYYREGQSTDQVAALLDLSEPAVRKRLSRARESLRESMLERLGNSIVRTAPTTAFTAGVMAALAVGAPSTAAAAGATGVLAKVASTAGSIPAVLLMLPGLVGGLLGGLLGVHLGMRGVIGSAIDDEEKAELMEFRSQGTGAVILAMIGYGVSGLAGGPWLLPGMVLSHVAFVVTLSYLYAWRLPQILERRRALEIAKDPDAWRRHRRERIGCWIGLGGGIVAGTAGLVAGLLAG